MDLHGDGEVWEFFLSISRHGQPQVLSLSMPRERDISWVGDITVDLYDQGHIPNSPILLTPAGRT